MIIRTTALRQLHRTVLHTPSRPLTTSPPRLNLRASLTHPPTSTARDTHDDGTDPAPRPASIPDKLLGTREQLEARRKAFEDKYGDKLRRKMEQDKVSSLADLKSRARLASRQRSEGKEGASAAPPAGTASSKQESKSRPSQPVLDAEAAAVLAKTRASRAEAIARAAAAAREGGQSAADRAGVKPLSSILNLDLIFAPPTTPVAGPAAAAAAATGSAAPRMHTTAEISLLWQAYHSTHPTLAPTFLSASIPPRIYSAMAGAAHACPRFVIPLPREPEGGPGAGQGEDAAFEMYYLQWLFHPTRGVAREWRSDAEAGAHPALPMSSVLFTPLAEFRSSGEWAQPHLVLTHYTDLHNIPPAGTGTASTPHQPIHPDEAHHPVILMRGEILSHPSSSALASPLPTSHLSLTQSQAQLLAMAVQRFYAAAISPEEATAGQKGENDAQRAERQARRDMLDMFARGDPAFDIAKLVKMAYAGVA